MVKLFPTKLFEFWAHTKFSMKFMRFCFILSLTGNAQQYDIELLIVTGIFFLWRKVSSSDNKCVVKDYFFFFEKNAQTVHITAGIGSLDKMDRVSLFFAASCGSQQK